MSETETPTLTQLAEQACQEHDRPQEAIEWMISRLTSNGGWIEHHLSDLVRLAVSRSVYEYRHMACRGAMGKRGWAVKPAGSKLDPGAMNDQARFEGALAQIIMDKPMPDGRLLGDWTREQLIEQADVEDQRAKGHRDNATFYRSLAEPMKQGQSVSQQWRSVDAWAVWEAVRVGKKPPSVTRKRLRVKAESAPAIATTRGSS